jgi:hypothetical protein
MLAECRARARGVDGRDGIEIAINLAALKTNNKASARHCCGNTYNKRTTKHNYLDASYLFLLF